MEGEPQSSGKSGVPWWVWVIVFLVPIQFFPWYWSAGLAAVVLGVLYLARRID